jgi:hypothetical protein
MAIRGTTKWVQISPFQAKIVRNHGIAELIARLPIYCFVLLWVLLAFSFVLGGGNFPDIYLARLSQFIESTFLNGEPLPIPETVLLPIFWLIFLMIGFILSWLNAIVKDELIFDLERGMLIHLIQSRFSRLLNRQGSVKNRNLSMYSRVCIRVDSYASDTDRKYFYSLVIASDSPQNNNYFQIDRSIKCGSIRELSQSELSSKQLADLENLGYTLADSLRMPMVLEIDRNRLS